MCNVYLVYQPLCKIIGKCVSVFVWSERFMCEICRTWPFFFFFSLTGPVLLPMPLLCAALFVFHRRRLPSARFNIDLSLQQIHVVHQAARFHASYRNWRIGRAHCAILRIGLVRFRSNQTRGNWQRQWKRFCLVKWHGHTAQMPAPWEFKTIFLLFKPLPFPVFDYCPRSGCVCFPVCLAADQLSRDEASFIGASACTQRQTVRIAFMLNKFRLSFI